MSSTSYPSITAHEDCSAYGGRGPLVLGLTWAQFVIATFLISLRIYSRFNIVRYAGWALFWAITCWILGAITQVFFTIAVSNGLGNHLTRVLQCGKAIQFGKWSTLSADAALLPIGVSKVAIVAFILAVLGPTHNHQRWFLVFLAFSNVALNVMQMIKIIFACDPVPAQWDLLIVGRCHTSKAWRMSTAYLVGIWSVLSDFILAMLPITFLARLQMPLKQKLGLCILMGLGCVAGICGIMRTVLSPLGFSTQDESYNAGHEAIWLLTEMWLVLNLSCIPPLWPLIARYAKSLRGPATRAKPPRDEESTVLEHKSPFSSSARSVRKLQETFKSAHLPPLTRIAATFTNARRNLFPHHHDKLPLTISAPLPATLATSPPTLAPPKPAITTTSTNATASPATFHSQPAEPPARLQGALWTHGAFAAPRPEVRMER